MYNIYTRHAYVYRYMLINVSWIQQHMPLPLRTCAPPNRATSSMGGSSWCRSPHKLSHTSCTKQHNRAYSCRDRINTRHQGFHACAVDTYCHITPASCSQSHWQMFCIEQSSTIAHTYPWVLCSYYLCCVIVSSVCNLLTHLRGFEATSQDQKQEIYIAVA